MKKIIYIILVFVLFIGSFWLVVKNKTQNFVAENQNLNKVENSPAEKNPVSLCYYYAKKTDRGFYDKIWLRLDIDGEKVTGEYDSYPAEKDSKIGSFEGTVGPVDQSTMSRTADVWWDSFAEGMKVKEELVIQFGDGSASTAAGEMFDRGDGVYVYKDKTKLFYPWSISQIACEDLEEINAVEKYVQENIKTLATNQPVLGGQWYVWYVNSVPSTKTGEVIYEDGHIQSRATFEYVFDSNSKSVSISNFKLE